MFSDIVLRLACNASNFRPSIAHTGAILTSSITAIARRWHFVFLLERKNERRFCYANHLLFLRQPKLIYIIKDEKANLKISLLVVSTVRGYSNSASSILFGSFAGLNSSLSIQKNKLKVSIKSIFSSKRKSSSTTNLTDYTLLDGSNEPTIAPRLSFSAFRANIPTSTSLGNLPFED